MHSAPLLLLALLVGCSNEANLRHVREAPSAAITAPEQGEVVRQGDTLLHVVGLVSDSWDSPDELAVALTANGDALPVSVDADGLVQADHPLSATDLGPLRFTLLVIDSDGDGAEATVEVIVQGPLGPPEVTITMPGDGERFDTGATIAFQGVGVDSTTAADDLTFSWSSDVDGPLDGGISADGTSALITSALSEGDHWITLTATDEDGERGSDSVAVSIGALVVDDPIDEDPIPTDDVLPGDLMFSEMNVNPEAVDDEIGEWVELYNTASYAIDIGGYTFRDDDIDAWVLSGPIIVAPHDYIVLCANMEPSANGGVPCDGWFYRDWNGDGLALANGPDELVLTRPDGLEIDWLYYDDTWYTKAVAIGVDPAHLTAGENDDLSFWCNQQTITPPMVEPGTPGGINDLCL